ncbi:unnamed protein product [Vitrella brassicaformis CCMP3155]|uniref:V-SNARE coiled-coil homology domain-containing protein n=1 Tax=Vitrella brassicaformis (strain CCMP3155) TaxID=1169540 RepID=A0A0G4GS22_VITBC|nr:unnamed protein product [Vitrella brassicaformis CCMP3155]|eukprot:CEM33425.1 unnamed protein product [Vitrella brassicaformis CCMP3155]
MRDQVILASSYDKMGNNEKNDLDRAFQGHLSESLSRMAPGGRDKRFFGEGCLYLLADRELTCLYCVGTRTASYPERHAFACLTDLQQAVGGLSEDAQKLSMLDANALTKPLRKPLKELMDTYDRPAKFDKTAEVREKVDNVKDIMQENVKKILESHANIESLEQKTDNLRTSAQQFQRNAVDLRRMMWWRNIKVKIILALVILAIALYILLPIIMHAS